MKKFLLNLFVTCAFIGTAQAQLYIKNTCDFPVTVCVGWYQSGDAWSGFETKGWYNIEPGQKIAPGINFTSDNDHFYYYARSADGKLEWGDKYRLLTNNSAFDIKNADKQYVKDNNPTYEWHNFIRKEVTFGILDAREYTLTLSYSAPVELLDSMAVVDQVMAGTQTETITYTGTLGGKEIVMGFVIPDHNYNFDAGEYYYTKYNVSIQFAGEEPATASATQQKLYEYNNGVRTGYFVFMSTDYYLDFADSMIGKWYSMDGTVSYNVILNKVK